ncbi:TNF receptor-associated protein 1 homolog, mitochondrial-like [Schistocerca gregaria]|uniref:TNF receptor-associated protein 1 homolog, mitochondrial-like n=1 Tax=Schistocerca gregaria TaxID=7010 RepID=UPI00211E031E|nr:TNF receptor-associated protein 1 homolog, mitochondrial-like [Schistocerca gregaria]
MFPSRITSEFFIRRGNRVAQEKLTSLRQNGTCGRFVANPREIRMASEKVRSFYAPSRILRDVDTKKKDADDAEVSELQEELERLQREMSEKPVSKESSELDSTSVVDDEKALAEMLKKQEENMSGEGQAADAAVLDELIKETEQVTGPEAKLEFQAETRKLLDIVARSLYSDKEVFVRELISNASDALEKARFLRLTGQYLSEPDLPLKVMISADGERTLTIQDTGIGMTKEELIEDLGRIGHSGTGEYLKILESTQSSNLIGQFGVGFYSTFMVAKRIKVYSRSAKEPDAKGYVWSSDGSGSYSVAEAEGVARGTKVIIELSEECEEYAKKQTIENVVKKYSNFVGFDIYLNGARVNTIKALWTMPPSQISEADHKEFYQFISHSHDSPIYHLHYSADSPINVRSIFYIPETHMEKYGLGILEPGVSLFARKVLIQAKCKGILPDWLRFIKGVVDSEDIPLNLSRELLQDSGLIKRLSNVLTRRILKYLDEESKLDEDKYMKFYHEYAQFLKQGICTDIKWKEDLAKLMRIESSKHPEGKYTSFEDYISNMPEKQLEIYYLCIPSRSYAETSPYFEAFQKRNVEVLFLYTNIDEFVMSNLAEYKGKKLVSIESSNASESIKQIGSVEEPESSEQNGEDRKLTGEEFTNFANWLRETLVTRVTTVVETSRLSSFPAVVVDHESAAFRRMMKMVDPSHAPTTPKVQLQINPSHPIIVKLNSIRNVDPELARDVSEQIMDNAMIQAGLLDDNRSMVPRLVKILDRALKNAEGAERSG